MELLNAYLNRQLIVQFGTFIQFLNFLGYVIFKTRSETPSGNTRILVVTCILDFSQVITDFSTAFFVN